MFTGIIKHTGELLRVEKRHTGGRLFLSCPGLAGKLKQGDSLAVDGVCLTLVARSQRGMGFDLSSETTERSSLSWLRPGWPLNLELPLCAGEPLGGHVVSGHVDGTAKVLEVAREGEGAVLIVGSIPEVASYVYPKCSLAVNGVSLTVARTREGAFEVALIPETLRATNLSRLSAGDAVNLEADTLVKAVVDAAGKRQSGLTMGKLKEAGF